MNEKKLTSGRGGKRAGAGRKTGSIKTTPKSDRTEMFTKRITKEEKIFLEQQLEKFRNGKSKGE